MTSPTTCLSVCLRCKPAGFEGPDEERPGAELVRALSAAATRRAVPKLRLRAIRCLSQCKRPCVVAFSGENRFTYLFGDLDPARDVAAILETLALYDARPDGFMERTERPETMRAGILGRIPPLASEHPFVQQVVDHP